MSIKPFEPTPNPYPISFLDLFTARMDLEASFRSLQNNFHFYSEALRGRIRTLQVEPEQAANHLLAARLMSSNYPDNHPKYKKYRMELFEFTLDNTLLLLAMGKTTPEILQLEYQRFQDFLTLYPEKNPGIEATRIITNYLLNQGSFLEALEGFKWLVERQGAVSEDLAWNYVGAAAAALEAGDADVANNYYMAAQISSDLITEPLQLGLFFSRALVLTGYWGRLEESRDWMQRLQCLRLKKTGYSGIVATSINCIMKRALLFLEGSRRRNAIILG